MSERKYLVKYGEVFVAETDTIVKLIKLFINCLETHSGPFEVSIEGQPESEIRMLVQATKVPTEVNSWVHQFMGAVAGLDSFKHVHRTKLEEDNFASVKLFEERGWVRFPEIGNKCWVVHTPTDTLVELIKTSDDGIDTTYDASVYSHKDWKDLYEAVKPAMWDSRAQLVCGGTLTEFQGKSYIVTRDPDMANEATDGFYYNKSGDFKEPDGPFLYPLDDCYGSVVTLTDLKTIVDSFGYKLEKK